MPPSAWHSSKSHNSPARALSYFWYRPAFRPLDEIHMRLPIVSLVLLLAACSSDATPETQAAAPLDFPIGVNDQKSDTFGRSLVGAPNAYIPDQSVLNDPARESELKSNMKARREFAWQTAYKILEPVPLLGLADQLQARPECAEGINPRDLDKCSRQADEAACGAFESNGVADVCKWVEGGNVCTPACDNLTLGDREVPKIPRWETWYGLEDVARIFKYAYGNMSPEDQVARTPFTDAQIGEAFVVNNSDIERSSRWPLWRYTDAVSRLFDCTLTQGPNESTEDFASRCAEDRQSQFSGASGAGGGIARMVYSPAMVLHMMRNYGELLDCSDDKLETTWCGDGVPCVDPPDNFSTCFRSEFPADASNPWAELDENEVGSLTGLAAVGGTVLVKATWARVGFEFELPAYDTDAAAMARRVGAGQRAQWSEGDRRYDAPTTGDPGFPTANDIYTIKTQSGGLYRLTGLHIMTKELRHWQWITLWWSDKPSEDFGEDRPESFEQLPGVWSNYKMCVVTDFVENDEEALARFNAFPSLQAALEATGTEAGKPTWCSNPYIEHEAGNARTNCMGCHQHAGSRFNEDATSSFDLTAVIPNESEEMTITNRFPANGRLRRRNIFASDYSWAFSRLDDLTELVRSEVEFNSAADPRFARINAISLLEGDVEAGEAVFRGASPEQTCTDCHGQNGEGGFGPSYDQVFAQKTDWQVMLTILGGRGAMPAWGEKLSDQQLADLMAFLRTNFASN